MHASCSELYSKVALSALWHVLMIYTIATVQFQYLDHNYAHSLVKPKNNSLMNGWVIINTAVILSVAIAIIERFLSV